MRAPAGPAALAALQRSAGNRAVARLVEPSTPSVPTVQRKPERQAQVDAALSASPPDVGLVKDIDSFAGLPAATLAKLAHILVYNYSLFLGPVERGKLTAIFEAFGPDIGLVAKLDPFLLEKCMKEWPSLMLTVPAIRVAADSFKTAIKTQATKNIDANVTYLSAEYKRMGGKEGVDPKAGLEDSKEQNERATMMVGIAEQLLRVRKDQKKLTDKPVGFAYNEHNPFFPTREVTFTPDNPPGSTWHPRPNDPDYATLNEQWHAAVLLTGQLATTYPWLMGLLKEPATAEAKLQALVDRKNDPYAARAEIMGQLFHQLFLAQDLQKRAGGELDWYDLVPIRDRLLSPDSSLDSFDILVGRGVVGKRSDEEWWTKFGLTLAADAAMLVVSLATAGAAPLAAGLVAAVVATGIPAARAYAAFEDAKRADDANRATVLPGTDLVGAMQGDIKRAEATALLIEAALALVGSAVPLAAALRAEAALVRIAEMSAAEQAKLIAGATLEKGGVYVSSRTGLTLAELAAKVEPGSAAFQRLEKEFLDLATKGVTDLAPAERAAIRDALVSVAADAAGAAAQDEAEIGVKFTQVPVLTATLVDERQPVHQPAVQKLETYATQFEAFSTQQLLAGAAPLPRMDYVFQGKYSASDQGIDLIGVTIDRPGQRFSLYHWECKFVLEGNEPKLGRTKGGLWVQTGDAWTRENARLFITSPHPSAVSARGALLEIGTAHNAGRAFTEEMLWARLVKASTSYIVPEYALASKMQAVIRGIARWKKVGGLYRIPLPFKAK